MAARVTDHKPIPLGDSAPSFWTNEDVEQAAHPLRQRYDATQTQGVVFLHSVFILNEDSTRDAAKQCQLHI